MVNTMLTLCYRISRSSSPHRAALCEGVNGRLATITYVKRITYVIDKTLALC